MAAAAPMTVPGAIGFAALALLCVGGGFFGVVGGDYLLRSRERPMPVALSQPINRSRDVAPLAFAALPELPPLAAIPKATFAPKSQRRRWRYAHSRHPAVTDRTAEYAADAAITKRLNETAKAALDAREGH